MLIFVNIFWDHMEISLLKEADILIIKETIWEDPI